MKNASLASLGRKNKRAHLAMLGPLGPGAATNLSTGAAHPVDAVPTLTVPIQLGSPRTAGPTSVFFRDAGWDLGLCPQAAHAGPLRDPGGEWGQLSLFTFASHTQPQASLLLTQDLHHGLRLLEASKMLLFMVPTWHQ